MIKTAIENFKKWLSAPAADDELEKYAAMLNCDPSIITDVCKRTGYPVDMAAHALATLWRKMGTETIEDAINQAVSDCSGLSKSETAAYLNLIVGRRWHVLLNYFCDKKAPQNAGL